MTLNKLNLPAMGQLGIIVKSIDRSIPYYADVMNIRPWYRTNIVEEEIYYKDRRIDLELDVVIGYSGSLQFELIQVVRGEENIYTELINTRGEGLHHVGFIVANIKKKTEMLRGAGFTPIQHGFLKTKGNALTRFAYFDTMETYGYILELIETTLLGIPVGMSRQMIKLGRLLGDVEVFYPSNADKINSLSDDSK